MFFIKDKNKDNEVLLNTAADRLAGYLKSWVMDERGGIEANLYLKLASIFSGIACLTAAQLDVMAGRVAANGGIGIPLMPLETDAGTFYMGDAINKYLFDGKDSVYSRLLAGIGSSDSKYHNEIEKIIANCSSKYGDTSFRLWMGQENPYEHKDVYIKGYIKLRNFLSVHKLEEEDVPKVFARALQLIINFVKDVFPKEIDPLKLSMETIIFYSHMECREKK